MIRIPTTVRRAFYSLPFFFPWVVGITWEKDKAAFRSAERSMLLMFCFLLALMMLYFMAEVFSYLLGSYEWYVRYVAFFSHGLLSFLYCTLSLITTFQELRGGVSPLGVMDRLVDKFESFLSF